MKAVLFDLDDTLFDHRHSARCVLQELQAAHSRLQAHPLDFLEREDLRLLDETHTLVMAGRIAVEEGRIQRIQSLFRCCGEEITREYARELGERRQVIYRDSRRAVPGAIALLRQLKQRVRIGIVTNNFAEEQRDKLKACGLMEFVDGLVTSEEVGHSKPEPEIFRVALNLLDCRAEDAAMVGNSWEVDVMGALNSGIRAVWFNRYGMKAKADARSVIEITSLEPSAAVAEQIVGIME